MASHKSIKSIVTPLIVCLFTRKTRDVIATQPFRTQLSLIPIGGEKFERVSVFFHFFNTFIPPHVWFDRKSTGEVTPGWTGYLSRKSSSAGFISLFIRSIWGHDKRERNVVFPTQTATFFCLIRFKQSS